MFWCSVCTFHRNLVGFLESFLFVLSPHCLVSSFFFTLDGHLEGSLTGVISAHLTREKLYSGFIVMTHQLDARNFYCPSVKGFENKQDRTAAFISIQSSIRHLSHDFRNNSALSEKNRQFGGNSSLTSTFRWNSREIHRLVIADLNINQFVFSLNSP